MLIVFWPVIQFADCSLSASVYWRGRCILVDVYSCGRSCSYIILFQHFDWCTGTKAALKTGLPLAAGICRVVSKDRQPGISPGYFHIGSKKKTRPKELPTHSIDCLLTAYTQWQIQGRIPPYLRVGMTPPPLLISRSGSSPVYITGNLKY